MTTTTPGIAGRTNYAQWDKIATDLVHQVDEESKKEEEEEKAKLGLDGKYAVSADDAAERAKAEQVKATKAKLDLLQQRETAKILDWNSLGVIAREQVPSDKRVIRICNVDGSNDEPTAKIVLSSDLSQLECVAETTNPLAKSFPDDAENDAVHNPSTKVYGLIKLMIDNVKHVEITVQSKLITGTIELHQCEHVKLILAHESIGTVQMDVCDHCNVCFESSWNPHNRILHAGCRNCNISDKIDSIGVDYLEDGAQTIGNASAKEYQFITSKVNGSLITEAVATTGNNMPMTQRQVDEAAANRKAVMDKALAMAEQMVQVKDANGNPLVRKTTPVVTTNSVEKIVQDIDACKGQGNEAFGLGEYAQAILQYSLAIDKTAELTDATAFATDVLYSNRAAAFLKLGQHEKALADANSALSVNPDNLKAAFRKGLALHASGQYAAALPILASAHKKEPKNQQVKQALQFCEVRMEQEHRKRMQQ